MKGGARGVGGGGGRERGEREGGLDSFFSFLHRKQTTPPTYCFTNTVYSFGWRER